VCTALEDAEKCVRWARKLWEAMQPGVIGSIYVNHLGQEADEGIERVKAAYGAEKYDRLVALKNTYDPTNLFRLNQNIKPTGLSLQSPSSLEGNHERPRRANVGMG